LQREPARQGPNEPRTAQLPDPRACAAGSRNCHGGKRISRTTKGHGSPPCTVGQPGLCPAGVPSGRSTQRYRCWRRRAGIGVAERDRSSLKGSRMAMTSVTSTTSMRAGSGRAQDLGRSVSRTASVLRDAPNGGTPPRKPGRPPGAGTGTEQWVTKQQLATHLQVTPRWIELQHPLGLPHLRRGGIVRYRISEVESWLLSCPATGGA